MSFKKLLEMTDKIAREELGNYYIISEARMNNYLYCLESGAKQVLKLKEDITTLQDQLQAAQALAATHLTDQELLMARERKRVAEDGSLLSYMISVQSLQCPREGHRAHNLAFLHYAALTAGKAC